MKASNVIMIALFLLALLPMAVAQENTTANHRLELIPDVPEQFRFDGDRRVNPVTGFPAVVYRIDSPVRHDTPENMARQYLRENAAALGLHADLSDLRHSFTRETPGGFRIRFEQYLGAYRVLKSTICVSINRNDRVVFLTNGYKVQYGGAHGETGTALQKSIVRVSAAQALQSAKVRLGITEATLSDTTETVWYVNNGIFRLTQRSAFISTVSRPGGWEVMTDAASGEIFRIEDIAKYQSSNRVNGLGWVFDPDPITSARAVYGQPGFVDNGDADSPELTAQLFERVLRDITYDPLVKKYFLKGPYAEIVDVEAPYTGVHEQDSSVFHFTRSHRAFEAVMCYYHIDKSMRYVNDTLGFPLRPLPYSGGVRVDPHGLNGKNNAWAMWDGHIAFGSPDNATDNAEEAGIILHELFHQMHDWVSGYGGSQVEGLSEGCADYWAQSDARSYHYFLPSDQQYNWLFPWGGLPSGGRPYLRVTYWPYRYRADLTGNAHTDGQMWSSCLMSIYDLIGKQVTDRLLLEGLSMTDINSSQRDAAFAFVQADKNLYGGAHLASIIPVFTTRGYITSPVTARFESDITGGRAPLTVRFTDRSFTASGTGIFCQWDFDNDGIVDASGSPVTYTYTTPGLYTVRLIASDGTTSDTLSAVDHISVNVGVFVWDFFYDPANSSGALIKSELAKLGVTVHHSRALRAPSSLLGYDAAFLSLGGEAYYGICVDSVFARTLVEYLQNGGRLFFEGIEGLRPELPSLMPLFGIKDIGYMYPSAPPPNIRGTSGSICSALQYQAFRTPTEQVYFVAGANGVPAFTQGANNVVGIQHENIGGAKSFALSYTLRNFQELLPTNTKLEFVTRLVRWFGLDSWPYAHTVQVSRQSRDTLRIAARVENHHGHAVNVTVLINNGSGALIDSLRLADDGLHADSASADGLWGSPYIPVKDDTIHVTIRTDDLTAGTTTRLPYAVTYYFTRGAIISVAPRLVQLGHVSIAASCRDTAVMVWNSGYTVDTLNVTLDPGNVMPDSAVSVSPKLFTLAPGDSQQVTFSIRPGQLLTTDYFSAVYIRSARGYRDTLFGTVFYFDVVNATSIHDVAQFPTEYRLEQNYPNPFNPATTIGYQLPHAGHVTLTVYDVLGREVATLVNEVKQPGTYTVQWDVSAEASGMYFYWLQVGNFIDVKKLMVVK
jgi:PKD repeat protein